MANSINPKNGDQVSSPLDKYHSRKEKVRESVDVASNASTTLNSILNTFTHLHPFLHFLSTYLPPVAIIVTGFATIWDLIKVLMKRKVGISEVSKISLGAGVIIFAALAIFLAPLEAIMLITAAGIGLAKKLVEVTEQLIHENKESKLSPEFHLKLFELSYSTLAFLGLIFLLLMAPIAPAFLSMGVTLLALSILLPVGFKLWELLQARSATDESLSNTVLKSQAFQKNTDDLTERETSHEHAGLDSTATTSYELAKEDLKTQHRSTQETEIAEKALDEIRKGMESKETSPLDPEMEKHPPDFLMPQHHTDTAKQNSKSEVEEDEPQKPKIEHP